MIASGILGVKVIFFFTLELPHHSSAIKGQGLRDFRVLFLYVCCNVEMSRFRFQVNCVLCNIIISIYVCNDEGAYRTVKSEHKYWPKHEIET